MITPPKLHHGLGHDRVKGFTFSGLEVSVTAESNKTGAIGLFNSSDIHFHQIKVHGTLDNNPEGDGDGFRIKSSQNISITGSEFQDLRIAIGHGDSRNLVFSGNYIHHIGMDGIRGGGSSDVEISHNYFAHFFKTGGHADAIQFYTGNIVKVVENITISGNIIAQGAGQEVQGIFMRNEEPEGLFNNVVIADNLIIGANWNGIAVSDVEKLSLSGNVVLSAPGETTWIRVSKTANAVVAENAAAKFLLDESVTSNINNVINAPFTSPNDEILTWLDERPALLGMLPAQVREQLGDLPSLSPPIFPLEPSADPWLFDPFGLAPQQLAPLGGFWDMF